MILVSVNKKGQGRRKECPRQKKWYRKGKITWLENKDGVILATSGNPEVFCISEPIGFQSCPILDL